jgi:hypothetical protein
MNDVVKWLAKKAHEEALAVYRLRMETELASDVIFVDIYDSKFAQLIIDICIDLVEDGVDHREPASTYGDKIRDHFGMEVKDV